MRFYTRNGGAACFIRRPLLSLSSFVLATAVGLVASFTFSTAYDMIRARLSSEPETMYGVWQGDWQGTPAVTITLKEDAGRLSGTAQFSKILKSIDGPTVIGRTRELALAKLKLDGNRLSFELPDAADSSDTLVEMEMNFLSETEAELRRTGGQAGSAPEDREVIIRMKRERSF